MEKILEYILYMFLIVICCFKGGINFFGGLFVLTSGILIYKLPNRKEFFQKYRYELIFTGIYLIGCILEIFSVDGISKSYKFLYKNFYFLMIPGLLYFYEKEKIRKRVIYLICFSLLIGIFESFRQFYIIYGLCYESWIRVESFFDIMRWGSALQMVLLLILPMLRKNIFLWGVFVLGIGSLILNNSRGPWISFLSCLLIYIVGYLLFYKKKIKIVLGIGVVIVGLLFSIKAIYPEQINKINARLQSSRNLENNYSNLGRTFMWKENLLFLKDSLKDNKRAFFFGVGLENKITIGEYIVKKENWKNANSSLKGAVSFSDAHNMYIHTFVRKGVIYGLLFWGYMCFYILKKLKERIFFKDDIILGSLLSTLGFFIGGIFYGYIFTFDTFVFFTIFILGVNYNKINNR